MMASKSIAWATETATQLEQECIPANGEKVRLLDVSAVDGRTRAAKQVKAFETQLATDLGNDLTEAQRALSRRAAVLVAVLTNSEALWAKDGSLDLGSYVTATNSLRRLLVTLGIARVQRPAGVVELMSDD